MHVLYSLLIALANNLDNISVRIAYSIKGIKISTLMNGWISVITFVISTLAATSGHAISTILPGPTSSIISMVLLVGIGAWFIFEPYVKKTKVKEEQQHPTVNDVLIHPDQGDMDHSNHIDFKEATILGVALSINNIGGGISAGMIGLNPIFIGLFSALISFIALFLGNYVTGFFVRWNLGNKATIASGVLLILIGLKQLL